MQGRGPLEDVAPGQPLEFQARTVNAWNAAARAHQGEKRGATGGAGGGLEVRPSVTVLVQNDAGSNASVGHVLSLGDVVGDLEDAPDAVQRRPVFAGTTPASEDDAIAILDRAIPDGEIGRAIVQGVAVVDVEISSAGHEFAKPSPGNRHKLVSAECGPARILSPGEREPGLVTCAVLLMGPKCESGGGNLTSCFTRVIDFTCVEGTPTPVKKCVCIGFAISDDPCEEGETNCIQFVEETWCEDVNDFKYERKYARIVVTESDPPCPGEE